MYASSSEKFELDSFVNYVTYLQGNVVATNIDRASSVGHQFKYGAPHAI